MFSATDIANYLACQHTATLDHAESRKEIKKPFFNDPVIELLQKLGLEHEKQYLHHLIDKEGLAVTQIDVGASWQEAASEHRHSAAGEKCDRVRNHEMATRLG